MKLFIAILITLFFIGSIITFCIAIKKMKNRIKECEEGIKRCTNEYANDPTDNNWLYMKFAWKEYKGEFTVTLYTLYFLIGLSLFGMIYIDYMLYFS